MRDAANKATVAEAEKLANGRDHEAAQSQEPLTAAALKMLRDDPTLQNRGPEHERKLRGLLNKGKLKAPAGLAGRDLDTEIVEAVERAREEFRRKPKRDAGARDTGADDDDGAGTGSEHGASPGDRARPFPRECIRGTCEQWIETLEPRGEWPVAFLFAEWRMIHSMAIARRRLVRHRHAALSALPRSADRRVRHHAQEHQHLPRCRADPNHAAGACCVFDNVSSIEGVLEQLDDRA